MSQIAQALAKAKERTGLTTAPFAVPGQGVKPSAPPQVKNNQRTWVVLLSIVVVVGGLSLWYSSGFGSSAPGGVSGGTAGDLASTTGAGAGSNGTANSPRSGDMAPIPVPEIQDAINSLLISAVMPGEQPRIMFQGRVIGVGQPVDGNIIFAGIKSERLVFTDADGAVYLRRY